MTIRFYCSHPEEIEILSFDDGCLTISVGGEGVHLDKEYLPMLKHILEQMLENTND